MLASLLAVSACAHALPVVPLPAQEPSCPARAAALCGPAPASLAEGSFPEYAGCFSRGLGGDCGWALAAEVLAGAEKHPCKDGLRKYCGKELDKLDKAVKDTQVVGTLEAALDVVSCVAHNVDSIWKVCKPFEGGEDDNNDKCRDRFAQTCPKGPEELTGADPTVFLGEYVSRVRCAASAQVLGGDDCNRKALSYVLEDAEAYFATDDKKPCKDKLHKTCGKEIDALEKALKDTSIISSLQASVHLANCVIKNLDDIAKACHLTEEEEEEEDDEALQVDVMGGNKPTKKPTKPTKKPTPKPSNKPPTKKPTPKPSKKPSVQVVADFVNMALGHDSEQCTRMAMDTCATEMALVAILSAPSAPVAEASAAAATTTTTTTVEDVDDSVLSLLNAEEQNMVDSAGDFMLQMCLRANMDRVLRACEGGEVMPGMQGEWEVTFLRTSDDDVQAMTLIADPDTNEHHPPCRNMWDNYMDPETQHLPPCPPHHHRGHHHHHHHSHHGGPPCRNPWDPEFLNLPPCPEHHHCSHHNRHHHGVVAGLGLLLLLSGGVLVAHRRRRAAALAGGKKKCCRHRRRTCCGGRACEEEEDKAVPAAVLASSTVLDVEANSKEGYVPLVEPQAQQ